MQMSAATEEHRNSWRPLGVGAAIGVVILGLVVGLSFCGSNKALPAYVKDVVAYEEGTDAMVVYFVLADASGEEVRSAGEVTLNVYESYMDTSTYDMEERLLWAVSYDVEKSDFAKVEVGVGNFARKRLLCSLGRVEYWRFTRRPSESSGRVELIFRTGGGTQLRGETSIFF